MSQNLDWDIMINYLDGSCSESERQSVEDWAASDSANKQELNRLIKLWKTPEVPVPKPDLEYALKIVRQRIDNPAQVPSEVKETQGKAFWSFISHYIFNPTVLKTAGALLFLFAFYFVFNFNKGTDLTEVTVKAGEIRDLVLSDGSKVKLDAGSKLEFPDEFHGDTREVYLSGEGYFEVEHDPQRPFIVHADIGRVKVLGTKFNIRAWETDSKVSVTVTDGRVAFGPDKDNLPENEVFLTKGYSSSLGGDGIASQPEMTEPQTSTSWINREMHFQNSKLSVVINQLERWYDLKIQLPSEKDSQIHVTVYLENKPVEEIVEMLALVMDYKYTIKGNFVVFSNKS